MNAILRKSTIFHIHFSVIRLNVILSHFTQSKFVVVREVFPTIIVYAFLVSATLARRPLLTALPGV
jgi:hypothetical protein